MSELNKRDEALSKESVISKARNKAQAAVKKDKKESLPTRIKRWLKDMRGELKKVTWPSGKDTLKNVGIVIACVLIVGVCIWVFDFVARHVVEALLNLFN